eukprot:scaffold5894_cov16-Prasinocladus_malaysianus.AAC.1
MGAFCAAPVADLVSAGRIHLKAGDAAALFILRVMCRSTVNVLRTLPFGLPPIPSHTNSEGANQKQFDTHV